MDSIRVEIITTEIGICYIPVPVPGAVPVNNENYTDTGTSTNSTASLLVSEIDRLNHRIQRVSGEDGIFSAEQKAAIKHTVTAVLSQYGGAWTAQELISLVVDYVVFTNRTFRVG